MSKKPKEVEESEIEETDEEETVILPDPATPLPTKKKAVNIMDSEHSSEPPKRKKESAPAVDLSPVLDEIKKGFEALAPKPIEEVKKDDKKMPQDFLEVLGDW